MAVTLPEACQKTSSDLDGPRDPRRSVENKPASLPPGRSSWVLLTPFPLEGLSPHFQPRPLPPT